MSSNPLYQRLKELDPNRFEDLCFQLLTSRHPTSGIARINGAGGDGGIDLFSGELTNGPTVWQCKYFVDRIRSAQKKQIKKSLKAVISNYQPKLWILCVPIILDASAFAWLQELKKDNQARIEIALYQAPDIVNDLIYYRPVREIFFPSAVLDGALLRSQLSGTGQFSDSELESLTSANVDEYVKRLRDCDGRFDYQVTFFPRDTEQVAFPPKLLASITKGDKRVDVYARDEEALRRDPPCIVFETVGEASRQLQKAIETGTSAELLVSNVRSAFEFIAPLSDLPQQLLIQPMVAAGPVFLNVRFGRGATAVLYEAMEFRRKRVGTKEAELETTSPVLPFALAMSLRIAEQLSATFNVQERFEDKDLRAIQKFINAMYQLNDTGVVEVEDAQSGKKLFSGATEINGLSDLNDKFKSVVNDLCEIAQRFGVSLRMPSAIDKVTMNSIPAILEIARTGRCAIDLSNLSVTLSKIVSKETFLAALQSENAFKFNLPRFTAPGRIFDKEIEIGPCTLVLTRARITNWEEAKQRYLEAPEAGGIVLAVEPLSPAEIIVHDGNSLSSTPDRVPDETSE